VGGFVADGESAAANLLSNGVLLAELVDGAEHRLGGLFFYIIINQGDRKSFKVPKTEITRKMNFLADLHRAADMELLGERLSHLGHGLGVSDYDYCCVGCYG